MPFDVNPATGNIDITPLVSYEAAFVADAGCALRLVLATRKDPFGKGSVVVQTALSLEQAVSLAADLQKMVERIRQVRSASSTH